MWSALPKQFTYLWLDPCYIKKTKTKKEQQQQKNNQQQQLRCWDMIELWELLFHRWVKLFTVNFELWSCNSMAFLRQIGTLGCRAVERADHQDLWCSAHHPSFLDTRRGIASLYHAFLPWSSTQIWSQPTTDWNPWNHEPNTFAFRVSPLGTCHTQLSLTHVQFNKSMTQGRNENRISKDVCIPCLLQHYSQLLRANESRLAGKWAREMKPTYIWS